MASKTVTKVKKRKCIGDLQILFRVNTLIVVDLDGVLCYEKKEEISKICI